MKIFPNPVHDQLTVTTNFEGPYQIELFNSIGQIIKSTIHSQSTLTLDMITLPAGNLHYKTYTSRA